MKAQQRIRVNRIGLHLFFWTCIGCLYTMTYNRMDLHSSWPLLLKDLFALLTIFYVTSYIIIPKWLLQKKYVLSILWLFVIYTWWGLLTYLAGYFIVEYLSPNERLKSYIEFARAAGVLGLFQFSMLPFYVLDFFYLVSVPLSVKITQAVLILRNQKSELEKENLDLELAFLKSQINPHFLFNTLNNIYILVSDGIPEGADYVANLGGIMRYLLHDSNKPMVPLDKEIDFLEDYIRLEKLRLNQPDQIDVDLAVDCDGVDMVPLILFPFVENAFKYGVGKSLAQSPIVIRLRWENGVLIFHASNGIDANLRAVKHAGGIGLTNVRRRLSEHYKNAHTLEILDDGERYEVDLRIHFSKLHASTKKMG